jgi:hypothetical protein
MYPSLRRYEERRQTDKAHVLQQCSDAHAFMSSGITVAPERSLQREPVIAMAANHDQDLSPVLLLTFDKMAFATERMEVLRPL